MKDLSPDVKLFEDLEISGFLLNLENIERMVKIPCMFLFSLNIFGMFLKTFENKVL